MNEATLELARAAVASPHWRWLSGMVATHSEHAPARVLSVQADEYDPPMLEIAWSWRNGDGVHPRGWLPDLEDPATLGCLLALVREAWKKPLLYVEPELDDDDGLAWYVRGVCWDRSYSHWPYRSEAAALVDALLSAPAQEANE